MKILITGATGFVGKELGKHLALKGHELRVLTRSKKRTEGKLPFPTEVFEWHPSKNQVDPESVKGVDAIIHLAGDNIAEGRWTAEKKKRIRDSRIESSKLLLNETAKLPPSERPSVYVSASGIGFYGSREDKIVTEDTPAGEGFLADVCQEWERVAFEHPEQEPMPEIRRVAIRSGIVLGHGGALDKMIPIFRKGLGGRLGSGKQWMSWIHVHDLVRLFENVLRNPDLKGPINGVSPQAVTNERFTEVLGKALRKRTPFPAPSSAIKMALGEMSTEILGSLRVLPKRAQEAGFPFEYADLGKSLEEICEGARVAQREKIFEQWIPQEVSKVFPFFADAKNLEKLTPPFLQFKILDGADSEVHEGALIQYRLKLRGFPIRWLTRIEKWTPQRCFEDSQIKGPYRLWNHLHEFIPMGQGTLIRDRVRYSLPLGGLGSLSAGWMVDRDVQKIFQYRTEIIAKTFSNPSES
jgi:uncharacterized protein